MTFPSVVAGALSLLSLVVPLPAQPPDKTTPTVPAAAAGDPLDLLAGGVETWKVSADRLMKDLRAMRPEWLEEKKTARIGEMKWRETDLLHTIIEGKLPVYETIIHFADETVQRVQFSLYNRGDAGDISPDKFKTLNEKAKTALSARAGNAGQDRGKAAGAVLTKGWMWKTSDTQYLLESSMKRQQGEDRPEFVRLILIPASAVPRASLGNPVSTAKSGATATLTSLKGNLKQEANGDVFIGNVPMVDQGQKGYCVVATAERVMRYYGADVDQHEMAQMADSSSGGGTSPLKMTEALDKIDSKFNLRLKRVMPWTVRGYLDLIKDYNRAARSAKAEQISEDEAYSVAYAYQEMDPDTLKKARATPAAMDKFKKLVHNYIDTGVPLMWSVHLGLYKEGDLPQSGGGHMRLIIGYNDTANEILFSDSWGAGHELKRINADEAWSMTSGLYGMEPKAK